MRVTPFGCLVGFLYVRQLEDPCARLRFVRIGCIFEIARCELRFFPVASVGCLANYPAIIERSSYPFRAAAAPMINIGVLAGARNDACKQRVFAITTVGRLYDFCTIRANALEVIDSRRVKWWTWSGSNRRPLPCHGSALPAAPQAHSAVPIFSLTGMHSSNQRGWETSNSKDFLIKMEPNG